MATKESLQQIYEHQETVELLEVVSREGAYTELAISIALAELKKRNVPAEVINSYDSVFTYKPTINNIEDHLADLTVLQKLICYFIVVPGIRRTITQHFIKEDNTLRLQQCNYYLIIGFPFLIIAIIFSQYSGFRFFGVWFSGFVPAYIFDVSYNRGRQISQIKKTMDEGKRPSPTGFEN